MTSSPDESWIAARRFGFGRSGNGAPAPVGRDGILAQLQPDAALLAGPELKPSAEIAVEIHQYEEMKKAARAAKSSGGDAMEGDGRPRKGKAAASDMAAPAMMEPPNPAMKPADDDAKAPPRLYYETEVMARLGRQIATPTPFVERLVNFWSNHFCVSAAKNQHLRAGAGAYEREAIRPHVLGHFRDMLNAVAHHPAMLVYLDNDASVGPNSKVGRRQNKGLNENLAREILELHTLGVNGGYAQADVTAFARALTGWGRAPFNGKDGPGGTFAFRDERHEPSAVTIMGKIYAAAGEAQAQAALDAFAAHPATARHIALKLARHFVSDRPPKALTDRLADTFQKSGGDLLAVTRVLVQSDEAWAQPPVKILPPWDFLVATGRAFGTGWTFQEANKLLKLFGQPTWEVPFPAGWPDADDTWAAPDSLLELLDAAQVIARKHGEKRNAAELGRALLGPLLKEQTLATLARAETKEQALALLLLSPEFLRR